MRIIYSIYFAREVSVELNILEIYFGPVVNSAGGAERVFCNMANELTERGHAVSAVCFEDKSGLPFYPLAQSINFYNLQNMGERIKVPKWRKLAREFLRLFGKNGFDDPYNNYRYKTAAIRLLPIIKKEKPDIIVCYDINSLQLLSKIKLDNIKIVFMLHMDAVTFWQGKTKQEIAILKTADAIQVLMPKDREFLSEKLKRDIEVIPNIVEQMPIKQNEIKKEKIVVSIGRLDKKQKQQHLLIESFSKIASKYPEWQLQLYGDTFTKNYRNELEDQIKTHNLDKQVFLMGVTNNSMAVLEKSAIFAFPSAHEGFPLAMTEAMAAGLPCIGLKSCLAVSQLIKDDETGIITDPTVEGLSKALEFLMLDEALRIRLGLNAKHAMKEYTPKKVWDNWEKLFFKIISGKNNFKNQKKL